MSITRFVQYRGAGFWASDFIVGVFLKHLIDRASQHGEGKASSWLDDCISEWRVIAVVSDYGLEFDSTWSEEKRQIILPSRSGGASQPIQRAWNDAGRIVFQT